MCRLLGFVADRPTSVVDVLGEDGFDRFTALAAAVHGDGWGMAWLPEEGTGSDTVRSATSPLSASDDATYDSLARTPLGRAGLLHLRWATEGLSVRPENTHPFVDDTGVAGQLAFAHNGNIAPIGRLEALLTEESCARLVGDTDSERYFRFVLQSIEEVGDLEAGIGRALGVLVREFPDSSLNALMLTPTRMFGVHINSEEGSPQRALRERFESEDEIPARHTTEYFAMDYRIEPHAVHVISSGLDEEGWTPVPANTAAVVNVQTREVARLRIRE